MAVIELACVAGEGDGVGLNVGEDDVDHPLILGVDEIGKLSASRGEVGATGGGGEVE